MQEQKKLDRSSKNMDNYTIYQYFTEEDLAPLTDKEFALLQKKLPPNTLPFGGTSAFYNFTENGFRAEGLQGDKQLLQVYRRAVAANHFYFDCLYRYTGVFKLCRRLGIKNIYDIGCGSGLQAFLLMKYPDVSYTGIESAPFRNPVDGFKTDAAQLNALFYSFTGSDRIYYVDKSYPYDFTPEPNNIAILLYTMMNREIEPFAADLSRDFERIIITLPKSEFAWKGKNIKEIVYRDVELWSDPFDKLLTRWKKAMPNYHFYQIREQNVIFATKIPDDDAKIKQNYTLINNNILTGAIDLTSILDN